MNLCAIGIIYLWRYQCACQECREEEEKSVQSAETVDTHKVVHSTSKALTKQGTNHLEQHSFLSFFHFPQNLKRGKMKKT